MKKFVSFWLILLLLMPTVGSAQTASAAVKEKHESPYPHLQLYFRLSLRDCVQCSVGMYTYFKDMQKAGFVVPTTLILQESKKREYGYLLKDLKSISERYADAEIIYSDSLTDALSDNPQSTFHIWDAAQNQELASGDVKNFGSYLPLLQEYEQVISQIPTSFWKEDFSMSGYKFAFGDDTTAYSYNAYSNELTYFYNDTTTVLNLEDRELLKNIYFVLDSNLANSHTMNRFSDFDTANLKYKDGTLGERYIDIDFFKNYPNAITTMTCYNENLYALFNARTLSYATRGGEADADLKISVESNFVLLVIKKNAKILPYSSVPNGLGEIGWDVDTYAPLHIDNKNNIWVGIFKPRKERPTPPHETYARFTIDEQNYTFDVPADSFQYPKRHFNRQLGYNFADIRHSGPYRMFSLETEITHIETGEKIQIPTLKPNSDTLSVNDVEEQNYNNSISKIHVTDNLVSVSYRRGKLYPKDDNIQTSEKNNYILIFERNSGKVLIHIPYEAINLPEDTFIKQFFSPRTFLYKNTDGFMRIGFIPLLFEK
ncbi:MAG: hypothetical protein JJT94_13595 [Bernardetiaceae bacterium]|nr:hypothetical protein [Bernardetiaceae bacterium]